MNLNLEKDFSLHISGKNTKKELKEFCKYVDEHTVTKEVNLHESEIYCYLGTSKAYTSNDFLVQMLDFFIAAPSAQTILKRNNQGQHYIAFGYKPNRRHARTMFDVVKAGNIADEIIENGYAMFRVEEDGVINYYVETKESQYSNNALVPGCNEAMSVEKAVYLAKRLDDEAESSEEHEAKRFIVARNSSVRGRTNGERYEFKRILNIKKNPFNRISYTEVFNAIENAKLKPLVFTADYATLSIIAEIPDYKNLDCQYKPVIIINLDESGRGKSSVSKGFALKDDVETYFKVSNEAIPTKTDDENRVYSVICSAKDFGKDVLLIAKLSNTSCNIADKEQAIQILSDVSPKIKSITPEERELLNISGTVEDFRESVLRLLKSKNMQAAIQETMEHIAKQY